MSRSEGASSMDEHVGVVGGYLEMDAQTRARYEKWKRNRIKKRVIYPGVGGLCMMILIIVLVLYNSGQRVEGTSTTDLTYAVKPIVELDFASMISRRRGPIVYLFNAHPLEMIGSTYEDQFEGEMSIVELTHILADYLESYGISTLVEARCVNAKLLENNWEFYMSYDAARYFVYDVIRRYPSLQFFVDLHRDGIPHYYATAQINGSSYARVLFVIGTDNPVGYHASYAVARQLHNMLEERKPGISRAIFRSGGEGRDGVYSQDISPMVQLIEIGTITSTVEEVSRTASILAQVLAEYVLIITESGLDIKDSIQFAQND